MLTVETEIEILCDECGAKLNGTIETKAWNQILRVEVCPDCTGELNDQIRDLYEQMGEKE